MLTVSPDTPAGRFASPPWHDEHPERCALEARLEPDHLARRIEEAVARLQLAKLLDAYAGTGSEAYRPDLLLRLALYEIRRGQHSPAAWWREARENGPARWLLRGCEPSRSCWYAFRDRLGPLLQGLNAQPLTQAQAAGLTPATRGSLDGTVVAAQASRHKVVNAQQLQERLDVLAAALAAEGPAGPAAAPGHDPAAATAAGPIGPASPSPAVAATAAAPTPAAGAAPPARPPRWLAGTPQGRRRQERRLRRARERLAELQARNRGKRACKRKAADKVVVSRSDPDSVVGRDKDKVYRPLYNVQVVDDLDSPFVLAYEVFAQQNDAGTLGPMADRLRQALGHPVALLLADTAYAGGADLADAADRGVTLYAPVPGDATDARGAKQLPKQQFRWLAAEQAYECPQGHRLAYEGTSLQKRSGTEPVRLAAYRCPLEHCRACPLQPRCTPARQQGRKVTRGEHEELVEALRARMATPEAKELYRLRGQTVELVNADWKQHRRLRRFSGRGLARARCEVGLVVLAHNLLTLLAEEKKAAAKRRPPAAPADVTSQ